MKTIEEMKSFPAARKNYRPEKVEKLSEEQMKWFRDAKFGMFIHCMPDDAAEQSALNRQGITENARRVKELEREVAELKALVAKLVDER